MSVAMFESVIRDEEHLQFPNTVMYRSTRRPDVVAPWVRLDDAQLKSLYKVLQAHMVERGNANAGGQ